MMNSFSVSPSLFSSVFLASLLCMWAPERSGAEEVISSEIPSETVEVEASTDTDNPSVDSEATEISSTEESRTLGGVLTMDISAIGNEDVEFLKAQHAEIKKTIASFSDQMSELATADLSADERQKAIAGIREQAREAIRNRILIDRKLAAVIQSAEESQTESDESPKP